MGTILFQPAAARADVDPDDPGTTIVYVDTAGMLTIDAGIGHVNHITITPVANGRVRVEDPGNPMFELGDCVTYADDVLECGLSGRPTRLHVDAHDGNDTIINLLPTNSKINAVLYGGKGDDIIYGGPGTQALYGGLSPDDVRYGGYSGPDNGADQLFGGCQAACTDTGDLIDGSDGNDTLSGGAGNDDLRGDAGSDTYVGGAGDHDSVGYADHDTAVTASLNGVADDGDAAAGEVENIPMDVEDLYGGWGADTLVGNDLNNLINGGPGFDRIMGGYGLDDLYGSTGDDRIYGDVNQPFSGDNDHLYGGEGDDRLFGEGGYDKVTEYNGEGNDICSAESVTGCESVSTA